MIRLSKIVGVYTVCVLTLALCTGVNVYAADADADGRPITPVDRTLQTESERARTVVESESERFRTPGNIPGMNVLQNPLGDITITQFFLKIIDLVLVFAIPLIVLYIMFAGFKYVLAKGKPGEIEQATSALTWAVVGGVLILGAKVLLTIIQNTVQSLQL